MAKQPDQTSAACAYLYYPSEINVPKIYESTLVVFEASHRIIIGVIGGMIGGMYFGTYEAGIITYVC